MKQKLKYLVTPMVVALALVVSAAAPSAAACLSDAEIQAAVTSGQILPLNEITARAGVGPSSKVLRPVAVCDDGAGLQYHISVLEPDGAARKLVLQATTDAS